MKRFAFGLLWLAAFLSAGLGLATHFAGSMGDNPFVIKAGAGLGLTCFAGLAGFNWLPGARLRRGTPLPWGPPQAVWLAAEFVLMQLVGTVACLIPISLIVYGHSVLTHTQAGGGNAPAIAGAISGYLMGTLWSIWYIRRLGPAWVADPSPAGIAWHPAPGRAYGVAAGLAAGIVVVVILLFHVFPPDLSALKAMPVEQIFGKPGWPMAILIILAVFIAPLAEEWAFRGGVFSAFASKFSPLWAGIFTTALFMLVHTQDKIHYPPGFIDVGLAGAACAWLRVKYGSIRPGMLLHLLYNAGTILAAGLFH